MASRSDVEGLVQGIVGDEVPYEGYLPNEKALRALLRAAERMRKALGESGCDGHIDCDCRGCKPVQAYDRAKARILGKSQDE